MKAYKIFLGVNLILAILMSACGSYTLKEAQEGIQGETVENIPPKIKLLELDNRNASFEYDSNIWREAEFDGKQILEMKKAEVSLATAEKISTDFEEEDFVKDFKEFLLDNGVKDNIIESELNGNPVLDYMQDHPKGSAYGKAMVVKTNGGYYEVTFVYIADEPQDYDKEVEELFQGFKAVYIPNFEFTDIIAGYNDQAVLENLSEDGRELIGKWVFKYNENSYRIYNKDYTFKEQLNDQARYIEGTWEYNQSNRLITHHVTKAMDNGEDITKEFGKQTQTFQVKNFDKQTLYGIVLENQVLRTFVKEE